MRVVSLVRAVHCEVRVRVRSAGSSDAVTDDYYVFGGVCYCVMVTIVNLKIALHVRFAGLAWLHSHTLSDTAREEIARLPARPSAGSPSSRLAIPKHPQARS